MRTVVLALCVAAAGSILAQPPAEGIQRLAWLQGCWEAVSADGRVEEQWMAPRGGSMVGSGRTVRGEKLVEYELVVIREDGDALVYQAHPSGQPSAEFRSTSVSDGRVVFENPGHDFPQRIGYERQGASLQAWVEGSKDGRTRRIDFPYRRTICAGD